MTNNENNSNEMPQICRVGTHLFMLGSYAENFEVGEHIVTDEVLVDDLGFICMVLDNVNSSIRIQERVELLVEAYYTRKRVFINREEAEAERKRRLSQL